MALSTTCVVHSVLELRRIQLNPWMVKTRFQILADKSVGQKQFSTYGQMIRSIYAEEGLRGFWKGTTASYVGCFEGAIQWMTYEKLKAILQQRADDRKQETAKKGEKAGPGVISGTELMLAGAIAKAGAIAPLIHEVVRTRMREQATNGGSSITALYKHSMSSLEEREPGLYGGLWIHLGRSVPNAAIMFTSFELISRYLISKVNYLCLRCPHLKGCRVMLGESLECHYAICRVIVTD